MNIKDINWKAIWKQTWPHLVAIAAFVLLCVVYFAPEFFENKQLPQGDVQSGLIRSPQKVSL